MKTKIISEQKIGNTTVLNLEVQGLNNVRSLTVCTQRDDLTDFYSSEYMSEEPWDMGWLDGSSYISSRYSFGSHENIEQLKNEYIKLSDTIEMKEEDCVELFIFEFDAGNGNSLLVSNIEEHLMYHEIEDVDFESIKNVVHMVGGSITDDSDIGHNISLCLISHPKTRGFKVPQDETYVSETADEGIYPWNDYVEYYGHFCSDTKELKKGEQYFDMFRAAQRLVLNNTELFPDRGEENMIDIIFKNYDYVQNIPDNVHLEYVHGSSNKFYNIELNAPVCEVIIEYGAIGKTSTTDGEEFETIEEARKFFEKKVISKIKSGYSPK